MDLKNYVRDIIEGRRRGRSVLRALSYFYRVGVALHNAIYDRGWVRPLKVSIPVISVGNIVVGGTGKTPLVRLLAKQLLEKKKVAVLSRGYKSQAETSLEPLLVTQETPVEKCGDEPFWLFQKLPLLDIWIAKDRRLSAKKAIEKGAEVIILDDGLQSRELERNKEIIVMHGNDLFGRGFFLPRGFLRDTPRRLKTADLIVVNHAQCQKKVREELAKYTEAPVIFAEMKLRVDASLQGKRVGIFCAIGQPEKFMQAIRDAGAEIVATFFKPDHDPFLPDELISFAKRSGADMLVCTEKDEVKLPRDFLCQLPILAVEAELEIIAGIEEWKRIVS